MHYQDPDLHGNDNNEPGTSIATKRKENKKKTCVCVTKSGDERQIQIQKKDKEKEMVKRENLEGPANRNRKKRRF